MIEDDRRLNAFHWLLIAAAALLGSLILFDAAAGINWSIWVALAVAVTLLCRRPRNVALSDPAVLLGVAAIISAGADARTTDTPVHVGIFWLTAVLLAAFLTAVAAKDWEEIGLLELAFSPIRSAGRVLTAAAREAGLVLRAATDSPSRPLLRRIAIVAPVVIALIVLLAGADPVIHSVVERIGVWLPKITVSARAVFFAVLLVVLTGACSRLPDFRIAMPPLQPRFRNGPTAKDAIVLLASTLATLVVFLVLQTIYLFVRPPGAVGSGVTYADYARKGFGQLCIVVTIVAGVILFAEHCRDKGERTTPPALRNLEFAAIAAAALILILALRRVLLYEEAYGFTTARVHATAYIVFAGGFLALLAYELARGGITQSLGRRSLLFGLAVLLVILYWNDQAWIMNRNIDRIRRTGKFDADYAATLLPDALPALVARKTELPNESWNALMFSIACTPPVGSTEWYQWNPVRAAAQSARETLRLARPAGCSVPKRAQPANGAG
jgi:hypothetical protein